MNKNIEVEGGEIAIRNSHGDLAIIPKDKRNWIKQKLSEGCHDCIDSLVETLPVASQYAQDGTVIPQEKKVTVYSGDEKYNVKSIAPRIGRRKNNDGTESTHLMSYAQVGDKYYAYPTLFQNDKKEWQELSDKDNWAAFNEAKKRKEVFEFNDEKSASEFAKGSWKSQYKEYDINSKEYSDLYNSGHLATYDKNTDTYIATPLKKVTITAEAPQWLKDKRRYESEFTKDMFIDKNMPKFSRAMGVSANNMHPNNVKEYDNIINDKVVSDIFKRKPTFDIDYSNDRLKTLRGFTQKELELIKNSKYSSKIEPSIWSKFEQGLLSIGNTGSPIQFKNPSLSQEEAKKEDNPLNILQPLNIPSKMVQSSYKKDYSFTDALKGKQNNANIGEDIITDPLNLVGAGLVGKLSKADKVIDATKILNKIDNNSFYRQIGKEGYVDAVKTGVIRSKPTGEYAGKAPYFVEGKDFDNLYSTGAGAGGKKPEYIFEMPQLKNPEEMSAFRVNQQDGYAPYIAGSKEIPISQGKIYRLNNKNEYELVDVTKAGNKVLDKTDDVVKTATSSVDDVNKSIKPAWQPQELPGLHLKSTMKGEAISKIVEPKTGLVNVEQALAIIGKESGGADKAALIKQGLGENIPKKMDYNEFRKTVQDQLIPLERQFATHSSGYGIDRLGYGKYKTVINERGNPILQPLKGKNLEPLENQTLILGNKNKFGRGSSAHGNPDETLGHIHFLRDAETPDVLTVTQIQSDAFQGTHRIMPKNTSNATALERQRKSLQRMEELQERNKSVLNKMKTEGVDEAGLPVQDYQIKQFEDIVKAQEQSNLFKKADIENFTQKKLLDKNHQERYLQELVDYAGKRGDINKVRVPTSETAAKVQGYEKHNPMSSNFEYSDKYPKELNDLVRNVRNANRDNYDDAVKQLNSYIEKNKPNFLYSIEHQTILKKYEETPKMVKKVLGQDVKIVTDAKGNTWYEFDIPKSFKEGKGKIKALSTIPIGMTLSQYLQSQQNNKTK